MFVTIVVAYKALYMHARTLKRNYVVLTKNLLSWLHE